MRDANAHSKTIEMKQRLDEHNIGVGQNALLLGRSLPHIRKPYQQSLAIKDLNNVRFRKVSLAR